jgi:Icc-related predicted phosphoesterase
MKKKIVAISDLHGNLPMDLPEGDILCICGDIFPLNIQTQILKCDDWLNDVFIPWTIELPYEEIILLAGNHDFYFEEVAPVDTFLTFDSTKITYLCDSWVTIYGIKFYGTPWCHRFGRWAFMEDDVVLESRFKRIPKDVDFLLTHDAPYGTSDICMQNVYWNNGEHIGSRPLRDAIIEKKPKYNLHGHLHSTNHGEEILNETKVYNVSILDERYDVTYSPLIIEFDK